MPQSISHKIFRNTCFIILSKIISLLASLLIIPFIINEVGVARYGIWVMLFAFIDYFNILEFGFGAATIKYTAKFYAKKRINNIGQIIPTSMMFCLIMLPVQAIPFLLSDRIILFFNIIPGNYDEALFVLRGSIIIFFITQFTSVFRNILAGIQRIDVRNYWEIFNTLLYVSGVLLTLKNGYGLKGLVILTGILRIIISFIYTICVFSLLPQIKGSIWSFNRTLFKDFLSYGIKLQITTISGLFSFQLDKLLIGHFLKIEFVTFYELGSKIASFIRKLPSIAFGALIPASAELHEKQDHRRLETIYIKGGRYITLISAPIAVFLSVSAPTVIHIWMGEDNCFPQAILTARILAVGYFFNIITGVVTSLVRGIGILKYEMNTSIFIAVTNFSLSLLLIIKTGFIGVLIGTASAMAVGNAIYIYRFNKYLGISLAVYIKKTFVWPFTSSLIAGAVIWIIQSSTFFNHFLFTINRLNMLVFFIIIGIFYITMYIYLLISVKFLDKTDLNNFIQIFYSLRK